MLLQRVACGSWAVWARTGEGVISHVVCVGKLGLSAVRGCWQGVSGLSPESLRAVNQQLGVEVGVGSHVAHVGVPGMCSGSLRAETRAIKGCKVAAHVARVGTGSR